MAIYGYAAEKFSAARRGLMLPHPAGVAESINLALHECRLGLRQFDPSNLDETAADWVRRLEELMNTNGIDDPGGRGTMVIKAEGFSEAEMFEVSRLVAMSWRTGLTGRPTRIE